MKSITAEELSKAYKKRKVVTNVSLEVNKGEIVGLLGPNGAGKTTLIRIINQITAPDSGDLFFDGRAMKAADIYQIGYLPEERGLYKKMKVGEQALYLAQLKGMTKADALKALKHWFVKFEIQAWWDKKVEELSKGMAQKVQFITTILHNPKLLIFDEPFSGFDPVNADLLKREILELKENGATIIFSTHNMSTVEDLCENISLVNKSKIVLQGNVAEIRASNATNTYLIRSAKALESTGFEILSSAMKNGSVESVIMKNPNETNNDIVQKIIRQTELISFEEILPTMNDIFIKTVKEPVD